MPEDPDKRDRLIKKLFGSDNLRQIDGLGGGDPLTSKVAILSSPACPTVDVEYVSGEVCLSGTGINYGITCGNLLAAVGPAAAQLGILDSGKSLGPISVHAPSSNSCIRIEYTSNEDSLVGGSVQASLIYDRPSGASTGHLLPTGCAVDHVELLGKSLEFSVVDAGAVYAFLDAGQLGICGGTPRALDKMCELRLFVEAFRGHVAQLLNERLPMSPPRARESIKIALVANPDTWRASRKRSSRSGGHDGNPGCVDIVGRILNRAKVHKAYAVSGAIATSVASSIVGTVPNRLVSADVSFADFRIGHPEGVLNVSLNFADVGGERIVEDARLSRSARILMCGTGFVE